jgi:hypothetical protein
MAIIYSYPSATPTASDIVLGTAVSDPSGDNATKSFTISDIIGLVPAAGTGGTVTSVGLTNTDNFLTISNSPITTSGNISIDLTNNGGTPSTNTFYRGDGQWAVPPNTVPYTYTLTSVANAPNIDINLTDNFSNVTLVKLINGAGINMTSVNNQITVANTGVNSIVGSAFINIDSSTATAPIVSLSATGTSIATKFLRGDNTWQTIAAGGTMSSWTLLGDTGTENIVEAESVKIKGDTGVSVAVADNGGVAEATISLASTVPTSIVAGSNVQVSGTGAVTVASANSVQNSPNPVGSPTVTQITNIVALTQAQYNALTPVDTHLYIITG